MKLGISYSVFDGEELLEASLRCMRPHVHTIVVIYQTISYTGSVASPALRPLLNRLHQEGLIDRLIHYSTQLKRSPSGQERRKRNIGLRAIAQTACTHYMSMDTDEFYEPQAFSRAMDSLEASGYDASVCPMIHYFKSPLVQLAPFEQHQDYYVPCITKLPAQGTLQRMMVGLPLWGAYRHGKQKHYPSLSDSTRQLPFHQIKVFHADELVMHHMSLVRRCITQKYQNTSAQAIAKTFSTEHLARYEAYYQAWTPPQPVYTPPDTAFQVAYPYTLLPKDPFNIKVFPE
ncbi:MAG: hypothetical protein ACKO37_02175 [Vampirovibrionales bacterium]